MTNKEESNRSISSPCIRQLNSKPEIPNISDNLEYELVSYKSCESVIWEVESATESTHTQAMEATTKLCQLAVSTVDKAMQADSSMNSVDNGSNSKHELRPCNGSLHLAEGDNHQRYNCNNSTKYPNIRTDIARKGGSDAFSVSSCLSEKALFYYKGSDLSEYDDVSAYPSGRITSFLNQELSQKQSDLIDFDFEQIDCKKPRVGSNIERLFALSRNQTNKRTLANRDLNIPSVVDLNKHVQTSKLQSVDSITTDIQTTVNTNNLADVNKSSDIILTEKEAKGYLAEMGYYPITRSPKNQPHQIKQSATSNDDFHLLHPNDALYTYILELRHNREPRTLRQSIEHWRQFSRKNNMK
ncbi:hypothetical protein GJ496_008172 [Pomphorhynchus laevis]|nr:hypothetical protein GJ496_008172 [Pomphorhynchus laevis]